MLRSVRQFGENWDFVGDRRHEARGLLLTSSPSIGKPSLACAESCYVDSRCYMPCKPQPRYKSTLTAFVNSRPETAHDRTPLSQVLRRMQVHTRHSKTAAQFDAECIVEDIRGNAL